MKREYRLPVILFLLTVIGLYLVESSRPKETDWSYSFYREHKKPFGSFIIHESLRKMWPRNEFEYVNMNLFEWLRSDSSRAVRNLMIINDHYTPSNEEVQELIKYVEKGNTVFISTEEMSSHLEGALGIDEVHLNGSARSIQNIAAGAIGEKESYSIETFKRNFQGAAPFGATFQIESDSTVTVLGKSVKGEPNFIKKAYGKGHFFAIGTPTYFSNYGMLHAIDREYLYSVLSFLPEADFVWNDYNTTGFPQVKSPLRYIWSQIPLRWAYLLTLIFALLWVMFKAKRNQRIIPIIPAIKNESLEFLGILSKVYFRRADHTDLATKKIKYFFDQLRSQFLIHIPQQIDSVVIKEVSSKSGYELQATQDLFLLIKTAQETSKISEQQLVKLHRAISQFYKETKIYGKRTK